MTTTDLVPVTQPTRLALCVEDLEALRVAHWKECTTGAAWATVVRLPKLRTPPVPGQRFLVTEPFRLLVRSYSSTVVYSDGRIAANYMDLRVEERDAARLLDTRHVMDAVATFGAEYTANVINAGGVTSSIRFHPAKRMPDWATRWEIEVVAVLRSGMSVRGIERHRITGNPREWNLAEVRRVIRLWEAMRAAHKSRSTVQIQRFTQTVWKVYCEPSTGHVRYAVPAADRDVLRTYMLRLPPEIRHAVADQVTMGLLRRTVDRQHMRSRTLLDEFIAALRWDVPRVAPLDTDTDIATIGGAA